MTSTDYDDAPGPAAAERISHRCANCQRPLREHEDLAPWIVAFAGDHLMLLCSRECEQQLTFNPARMEAFIREHNNPNRQGP